MNTEKGKSYAFIYCLSCAKEFMLTIITNLIAKDTRTRVLQTNWSSTFIPTDWSSTFIPTDYENIQFRAFIKNIYKKALESLENEEKYKGQLFQENLDDKLIRR
jgi:hypothetical protein